MPASAPHRLGSTEVVFWLPEQRSLAATLVGVFRRLYAAGFPIRRMRPVDAYGGSDFRSIEADNTSAFNCRRVEGTSRWSNHAYGRAIDVNPIENPYVSSRGTTSHPASHPYLDRAAPPSWRQSGLAVITTPRPALRYAAPPPQEAASARMLECKT